LSRPAGGHRWVSRPRRRGCSPRWWREHVVVSSSSLNKCLVQTTVSDAALEMKSAAPRGPHVVSFSRGKHPAAGLLSLLTTGGL